MKVYIRRALSFSQKNKIASAGVKSFSIAILTLKAMNSVTDSPGHQSGFIKSCGSLGKRVEIITADRLQAIKTIIYLQFPFPIITWAWYSRFPLKPIF
jgi:hypothetical protein